MAGIDSSLVQLDFEGTEAGSSSCLTLGKKPFAQREHWRIVLRNIELQRKPSPKSVRAATLFYGQQVEYYNLF